ADRQALIVSTMTRRGLQFDPQILDYLLLHGPHQASLLLQTIAQLEKLLKGEKTKLSNATLRQIYALIDEYRH
ncbi:DnaA regulatory inactivator Hda, partial [Acinetobacter baumannii]